MKKISLIVILHCLFIGHVLRANGRQQPLAFQSVSIGSLQRNQRASTYPDVHRLTFCPYTRRIDDALKGSKMALQAQENQFHRPFPFSMRFSRRRWQGSVPFAAEDDVNGQVVENLVVEDGSSNATMTTTTTTTTMNDEHDMSNASSSRRNRFKRRVTDLAQKFVVQPISYAAPMPRAVASVLKDATLKAVDMAVDEVIHRRTSTSSSSLSSSSSSQHPQRTMNGIGFDGKNGGRSMYFARSNGNKNSNEGLMADMTALVDEAFAPMEESLNEMENSLNRARHSLQDAKSHALEAMEAIQAAALAQAEGAQAAVIAAEEEVSRKVLTELYIAAAANRSSESGVSMDVSALAFEDVDYGTSEMAPPFLDEDQCLVPGEPIVRVEKAPENSRRIFAGIDIMASVDDVWQVLTDYKRLHEVVPNLIVNEVLDVYTGTSEYPARDPSLPEDAQCQELANQMKGALLRQVGGAKVAGISFSARTTLEVREWPRGMPDFAHFADEVWEGKSRKQRAKDYTKFKLQRYRFPRPFAVSSLPTRDISMQSIEQDDGEFRMYQGVWRMQPLPGCAPPGKEAMRLTYAVEVSPRAFVPVGLIEGRIVRDLCDNLLAIRDYVTKKTAVGLA